MNSRELLSDEDLAAAVRRYSSLETASLGYATVKDYCESFDNMNALATYMNDLKDVQRCWTFKSVLANVPAGGKLIEIGAGEPVIAHLLTRAGYHVTVVDPYEGAGNGPVELDYFRRTFPDVEFVVDMFSGDTPDLTDHGYDGCYSISVLEHIPEPFRDGLWAGMHRFLKPNATSIHAIDFVQKGWGDTFHLEMLKTVATAHGFAESEVDDMLARAEADPDTYFLSAEGHNRWRGQQPYEQWPMRRVMSIQLVQAVARMARAA